MTLCTLGPDTAGRDWILVSEVRAGRVVPVVVTYTTDGGLARRCDLMLAITWIAPELLADWKRRISWAIERNSIPDGSLDLVVLCLGVVDRLIGKVAA